MYCGGESNGEHQRQASGILITKYRVIRFIVEHLLGSTVEVSLWLRLHRLHEEAAILVIISIAFIPWPSVVSSSSDLD
ncbi:hypothetical protein BS47DRAFT_276811 [Hydnum rufescens UP504]|uniref:Uncharacterized protein n=1 Tax=Hydnum rufescens UP504 TaxID=1448309 RepID=A0A9P6AKY4_9AGAM|nr:hypothetical protein BS47DRAFT_276811 [Hydnum rufescens UP504]